jgi:hypothetical protein
LVRASSPEEWSITAGQFESGPSDGIAADLDDDGDPELVRGKRSTGEGVFTSVEVFTFHEGHVIPSSPAVNLGAVSFADVDNDGLPDALTRGPYAAAVSSRGLVGEPAIAPIIVYHAVKGAFVLDGVSESALAETCAGAPFPPKSNEIEDVGLSVVCARARGRAGAEIRAASLPRCAGYSAEYPADCDGNAQGGDSSTSGAHDPHCPAWFETLLGPPAPIRLR